MTFEHSSQRVLDWVHNRSVTEEEFSTLFMEWQKSKSLLNCLHPRVELLVTMDTCLSTLMGRSKSAKETVSKVNNDLSPLFRYDFFTFAGWICNIFIMRKVRVLHAETQPRKQ